MDHHNFIVATDRKSLHTQIKGLVLKAKEVANEETEARRRELQTLLEYEDKIYEEEFTKKVKSRIDEDIKKRNNVLLKIKEENERRALEFLESKRIQIQMESCYEIREALRYKETQHVKECQLEQITANERAKRRKGDLDKYWQRVQQTNLEREDNRQQNENCIRKKLAQNTKNGLDQQMQELEWKREEERLIKAEEVDKLAKLMEEIRLEEFDRQQKGLPAKTLQYRKELLDEIAAKKKRRCDEDTELAEMHCKMIKDLQRIEAEENAAAWQRKRALHKATVEYIAYVRRMRQLEEDQRKMRDSRIDDLHKVDICTKSNIQRELARKAEIAALCHAELKRQICAEYERRLREENERRECKIIENRFVHREVTREEVLEQRRKNREGLDQQIAELKVIRAQEESKYKNELKRAINDPEFCAQLAEKYIREGVDYLEPHGNWRILACAPKNFLPKPECGAGEGDEKPKRENGCIDPCGCEARGTKGGACN